MAHFLNIRSTPVHGRLDTHALRTVTDMYATAAANRSIATQTVTLPCRNTIMRIFSFNRSFSHHALSLTHLVPP